MKKQGDIRSLKGETGEVLGRALSLALELINREESLPLHRRCGSDELLDHLKLTRDGSDLETVIDGLREVLLATPSSASPKFINQLFGGRDPVATMAEMLVAVSNVSMYTFKVAGPQILLEAEVIGRMCSILGFDEGEGLFTPGGSISNLTAMIIARNEIIPDAREFGLADVRPTIYTSAAGHYSISKNASIIGIGRSHVRAIETDRSGRMKIEDLKRHVEKDLAAGLQPFFVNATAGTTVMGAFDPIEEIRVIADEHSLWMHVDGAFGASLLMCPEEGHLLGGIEKADSATWNPHKLMGVPLSCSAVLMRKKGLLTKNLNENAAYLFQTDNDELNPGTRSIQCGRRNDALKIWAAWRYHGDDGYEARIAKLLRLARYAANAIKNDRELLLAAEPQSVNVCFEVRDTDSAEICNHLDQRGELMVGYGLVNGRNSIRLVFVNPDFDESDVDRLLKLIKTAADELKGTGERS